MKGPRRLKLSLFNKIFFKNSIVQRATRKEDDLIDTKNDQRVAANRSAEVYLNIWSKSCNTHPIDKTKTFDLGVT